ncbi:hypothetical protein HMPREF9353_01659 [Treponema denticola F0402]|nr:hypothetical protein HMPREF9353_01659 [Treponema denticola F0402]
MTHTDNQGDNEEQKVKRYYYHSDHLGSAQFVTDWKGRQYEHIEYTPYGELWIEEVAAGLDKLPFRFTGKELDEETGLYYYGARYLDPKYSRWLSGDPALNDYIPQAPVNDEAKKHNENLPGMGGVFNTVNLHVYHYAGNNPIKYVDPDGRTEVHFFIEITGIVDGRTKESLYNSFKLYYSEDKSMLLNLLNKKHGTDWVNNRMEKVKSPIKNSSALINPKPPNDIKIYIDIMKADLDVDETGANIKEFSIENLDNIKLDKLIEILNTYIELLKTEQKSREVES